jgi:hypothetical protein
MMAFFLYQNFGFFDMMGFDLNEILTDNGNQAIENYEVADENKHWDQDENCVIVSLKIDRAHSCAPVSLRNKFHRSIYHRGSLFG